MSNSTKKETQLTFQGNDLWMEFPFASTYLETVRENEKGWVNILPKNHEQKQSA